MLCVSFTFYVAISIYKSSFLFIQVIAIVMDIFTDVDIFKEIVEASTRGISVYLLLDESNFDHFLKMTEKQNCQVQRLRVSHFLYERFIFVYIPLLIKKFSKQFTEQRNEFIPFTNDKET